MFGCCCAPVSTLGSTAQVVARKVWHGDPGPHSIPCDYCEVESERFLSCTFTARHEIRYRTGPNNPLETHVDTVSVSVSVDRFSGRATVTGCDCPAPHGVETGMAGFYCGPDYLIGYYSRPVGRNLLARVETPTCNPPADADSEFFWEGNTWVARHTMAVAGCELFEQYEYRCAFSQPYSYTGFVADTDALLAEIPIDDVPGGGRRFVWRDEVFNSPLRAFGAWVSTGVLNWPTPPTYADPCLFNSGAPGAAQQWPGNPTSEPSGDVLDGASQPSEGDIFCGHFNNIRAGFELWRSKWAEKKMKVCGHNWFRPCGEDRYLPDYGITRLISSVNNSNPNAPVLTLPSGHPFASGQRVVVFGGVLDRTAWLVASTTGTSATLGGKSAAASAEFDFAKAWHPPDCGPTVSRLRFPGAWPICGRAVVAAAAQDGASVVVTLAGPGAPLEIGDSIAFAGVGALSTHAVSAVISPTVFRVIATLGPYAGGGFATSAGAPSHTWNSRLYTGNYLVREWHHVGCGPAITATCTLDDPDNLGAGSLLVAHDTEGLAPAHRHDLLAPPPVYFSGWSHDGLPTLPERASRNGKMFIQAMPDPLHGGAFSCVGQPVWDFAKSEANAGGACSPNWLEAGWPLQVGPLPIMVEPTLTIPAGAPALPAGYSILAPNCEATYLAAVAAGTGKFLDCSHLNPNWWMPGMQACAGASGRFASAYARQIAIPCQTAIPPVLASSVFVTAADETVTAASG